jgi:hypothetical protein
MRAAARGRNSKGVVDPELKQSIQELSKRALDRLVPGLQS